MTENFSLKCIKKHSGKGDAVINISDINSARDKLRWAFITFNNAKCLNIILKKVHAGDDWKIVSMLLTSRNVMIDLRLIHEKIKGTFERGKYVKIIRRREQRWRSFFVSYSVHIHRLTRWVEVLASHRSLVSRVSMNRSGKQKLPLQNGIYLMVRLLIWH